MFPPGIEPGTFRVLGERDNRYTMETRILRAISNPNTITNTLYMNTRTVLLGQGYGGQVKCMRTPQALIPHRPAGLCYNNTTQDSRTML